MASANAQKAKQASRWGWVSGAVAGLESRLDTILDAGEGASATQRKAEVLKAEQLRADKLAASSPARTASPVSNDATTPRPTVTQSSDKIVPSPAPQPSQTVATEADKLAPLDDEATASTTLEEKALAVSGHTTTSDKEASQTAESAGPPLVGGASLAAPNSAASIVSDQEVVAAAQDRAPNDFIPRLSTESTSSIVNGILPKAAAEVPKTTEEIQAQLEQAKSDIERVELRRQEEVHENLERIDALQAKLRYLAKEASTAARQAAKDAGDEAMQKRLADQDDKIAQLMEEGIKLSKSEVTQTGTLRNMRAKTAEDAGTIAELQRKLNRTDRQLGDANSDVSRLERERAQAVAKVSRLTRVEREIASLREDASAKDLRIQTLSRDLRDASDRADEHQKKLNEQELEKERRVSQSLRDDIENAKIEQQIRDDRAKADTERIKAQLQRESDRHRNAELTLRGEITSLEGRLEVMRERTEEASSGSTGDTQAKLMRQIEILQSQYAVASENWQGIESSLQARVTALERERDESARHETEARKKARDAGSSARKLQDELDDLKVRSRVVEQELDEQKANAGKVHTRAAEVEAALEEVRSGFERERQAWNASLQTKLDEQRAKIQREMQAAAPSTAAPSVADMPVSLASPTSAMLPRGLSNSDLHGISPRWLNSTRAELSPGLRSPQHFSRRSSHMPPPQRTLSEVFTNPDESASMSGGKESGTPTLQTPEPEIDAFEQSFSPTSRNINDMVSTSTAAGPSVQLVERMSASVRRLETEKAASKEELARLQGQRDEARKEIVALMTEVDAKRDVDKKVDRLQKELSEVTGKFERMAEMFGEKSEQCEELEADVTDLKKIYRELVERTVTK